ncbi:hypothetical protein [Roseivirga misakiensis]|uniref:Uncharacterized protein n=1 Tax=Roseivirga misakiensis TaxID=1563681 RepID=A0A1E5T4F8_9BACT|nr:hypothetical protein [Roseivirga misakiensis]OEK06260.1 hypothetical protein BFP71_00870 [Roseivirga misakiensis]
MSLASIKSNWSLLSSVDPKTLAPAIEQIHRGVQFIAMAGKHYIKNEPDDSHTNLRWLPREEVLAGNWIRERQGNFRFAMRPKDLTLIAYNADMKGVANYPLNRKTNDEALEWIKDQLTTFGKDAGLMKMDIHYDIPTHETDNGAPYQFENPELFEEMAKYRSNSNLALEYFAQSYKTSSTVRTWPHHFDHGVYIPMVFDDGEDPIKSFSIGMGIPDPASEEPYYYITTWSKDGDNEYKDLPKLPHGQWISEPFKGAVLKASEIVKSKSAAQQSKIVMDFLKAGIAASLNILGIDQ